MQPGSRRWDLLSPTLQSRELATLFTSPMRKPRLWEGLPGGRGQTQDQHKGHRWSGQVCAQSPGPAQVRAKHDTVGMWAPVGSGSPPTGPTWGDEDGRLARARGVSVHMSGCLCVCFCLVLFLCPFLSVCVCISLSLFHSGVSVSV